MKIIKRLPVVLAWFGGSIFGLIVITSLVFLGINWRDQPVSEAAARLEKLYRDRTPVSDEDNAYVYFMGFSINRAEDPRAWGIKRIAWAKTLANQPLNQTQLIPNVDFPGVEHDFRSTRSAAVQALSEACRKVDQACLAALNNGEASINEWMATEKWLLDRYMKLLSHPHWLETVPFDERIPLPKYSSLFEGQKLLLTQAWLLAGQGDAAGVKKLLDADVRFWRQNLEESDILISKMIAVAALKRHFTFSNIILRRLPPPRAAKGMPELWRASITESERSMLRSLTGEWMFFDRIMRRTRVSPNASSEDTTAQRLLWHMLKSMIQFQDISNRYAERLALIDETLQVPYEQYSQAVARARAIEAVASDAGFPNRFYNMLGDALFLSDGQDFTSYAVKVADLEGLRRIAVLSAELRSQGIAAEQVPKKLSEAATRNPYTGKPFLWDEKERAIVFASFESGEHGRYAVLY